MTLPALSRFRIVLLTVACFATLHLSAQSWDAVANFNTTGIQTAGSVWTYGTETSLSAPFTLLPDFASQLCTNSDAPFPFVCSPSDATRELYYYKNVDMGPGVDYNNFGSTIAISGNPSLVWPANVLLIGPGSSEYGGSPPFLVIRWTAPKAGTYNISGFFENLQGATTDQYVLINGVQKFSSTYSGSSSLQQQPFSFSNISVAAGGTVDFIVDSGGNFSNQDNDALGFSATITATGSVQVFPHVAADTLWQTDFVILNTGDAPVEFTLTFHPDSGATIPIAGLGAVSQITGTVAAHGTAFYTTDTTVDADGWAELDSATPLSGVAVFREANDQTSVQLSAPSTSFTMPFDSTAPPNAPSTPYVDGLAIANPDSANQASITCQAYDSNGSALGGSLTASVIPPLGHIAFLLQSTAPFTALPANTRGQLVCTSTTSVSAVELRALGSQVSTMPVVTQ
jgi:hypothetical protein